MYILPYFCGYNSAEEVKPIEPVRLILVLLYLSVLGSGVWVPGLPGQSRADRLVGILLIGGVWVEYIMTCPVSHRKGPTHVSVYSVCGGVYRRKASPGKYSQAFI